MSETIQDQRPLTEDGPRTPLDLDGGLRPCQPGVLLARGVSRAMVQLGYSSLTEVTLPNGRRADVMALDSIGTIIIIEVKSSIEDYRSDHKWSEYREYCDQLYFAVPEGFPVQVIPDECGLIAADAFGAELIRLSPMIRLPPARRKALTLRFAQLAALRLQRVVDPASFL